MKTRFIDILDNLEADIIAICIFVTLPVLAVQVVARYVFSYSFSWAEQVARIGFVWICMAGISLAAKKQMHLKVEMATEYLPRSIEKYIELFSDIFTIVFCLFLSYKIAGIVFMQFTKWQTFPSMTWLPVWVMYIPGVLGTLGVAIRTFIVRICPLLKHNGSIKE